MDYLMIALTSLGSIVLLFILTKIIGNKQMSQLSLFDYINGITIGSIAAEMATDIENFLKPMTAMIVYALVTLLISVLTSKSIKIRRIFSGKPLILYDSGKLYRKNLMNAKIDLSEFLMLCRNSGYFNVADLQTAVLEPNGQISFLPRSDMRPVMPSDLNISPEQEKLTASVIFDGKIMEDNLKRIGRDENWLLKQLKAQKLPSPENIFLAVYTSGGDLSVYTMINTEKKGTVLE